VRMAKSSILLPQALQLYVQLLQMREPSPRRSRLASESSKVPQVLHRKQSMCHRLPAGREGESDGWWSMGRFVRTYQAQKPCLLPGSAQDSVSLQLPCASWSVVWRTSPQPLQG